MLTKEEINHKFKSIPNRKLTDVEKQVIYILVEKSKIQIDNSVQILNKGFFMFIAVIIVAVVSRVYDVINQMLVTGLYIFAIIVLATTFYIYQREVKNEQDTLDNLLENFLS